VGIREKLNDNPAITTGFTAGIIVIALVFIIYQLIPNRPKIPTEAFYTVDDGATTFVDDINKIPPFDKDGKQAVRAHVFTCDDGKTQFVAYLERYTPKAKEALEKSRQSDNPDDTSVQEMLSSTGIEYKKPGDKEWVNQMDSEKMNRVMSPTCPDGSTENLMPILPD
jgi:hypothetical protein